MFLVMEKHMDLVDRKNDLLFANKNFILGDLNKSIEYLWLIC